MIKDLHDMDIEMLQDRIDCLKHQNIVNMQRLCQMMKVEEKLRNNAKEKDEKTKRVVNENEELQKEMKVKKQFLFKM